jgi:nucleoside-diphosphate-sugar epimerase
VRVLDNLSTGNLRNLEPFRRELDFQQGDVRDFGTVHKALDGVEVVFHQAAMVSVPQSVADPLETARVNDLGTLNVLEAARRSAVRKVVFASTCAVYGELPELPKKEDMATRPLSPYATSKLHGENYAWLYSHLYGLETVCLRYFNVYGPRQDPSSPYSGVISIFMDRAARRGGPIIYGDGEQSRDFVYVADVVQANLLAARRENLGDMVINVGTGSFVTINKLWQTISKITGVEAEPETAEERVGDIRESCADISRAQQLLNYAPLHTLRAGLEKTWQWYKERKAYGA